MVNDLASITNPTERLLRAVSRACSVVGDSVHLDDPELLVAARPDIWPSASAIPTGRGPGGGPDGWNTAEVSNWFATAARAHGLAPAQTYRVRGRIRGLFGITRSGFVEVPAWFIANPCAGSEEATYVLEDGSLARGGLFAGHLITMATMLALS